MAKHKYIETPERMLELFLKYVEKTKSDPILKHVFVGRDGDSKHEELHRCLTMEGFENYVFEIGENHSLDHYFANNDKKYDEYLSICSLIKRFIRQDQIEGGMAGIYNASITQRLNALKDVQDITLSEQPMLTRPGDETKDT